MHFRKPLSVVPDEQLLEAAAQCGFHSSALFLAFDDALSGSSHHPLAAVFLARVERFKLSRTVWVELVSTSDGRVVDPVSGDG